MNRINTLVPFVLFAKCTVDYDGRASSHLSLDNHLIVKKADGSLLIHGSTLCNAINYQGPGGTLTKSGKLLISTRKKETITITIEEIISYMEPDKWGSGALTISRTEFQLRDKIAANLEHLLQTQFKSITREAFTDVGNIDILAIGIDGTAHAIEVKRGKASLAAVSQLKRYVDWHIECQHDKVIGYVASPEISTNALKYLNNNNFRWLQVSH